MHQALNLQLFSFNLFLSLIVEVGYAKNWSFTELYYRASFIHQSVLYFVQFWIPFTIHFRLFACRIYPFPKRPTCVPIYREKFIQVARNIPSWMLKYQTPSECYRQQFALDLAYHIICHRAQGQTLGNCTVSVELGLDNPDRHLPADIGSIVYVACTRARRLQDLYVGNIFPSVWKKIGSQADCDRMRIEAHLH